MIKHNYGCKYSMFYGIKTISPSFFNRPTKKARQPLLQRHLALGTLLSKECQNKFITASSRCIPVGCCWGAFISTQGRRRGVLASVATKGWFITPRGVCRSHQHERHPRKADAFHYSEKGSRASPNPSRGGGLRPRG